MAQIISAYIAVLRPVNGLIAALSVALGYLAAGPVPLIDRPFSLLLAALSVFLILGFGNVVNDLLDQRADLVNRPDRPLPSGRITGKQAVVYAGVLLLAGLVSARALSAAYFYMASGAAALLWLYSVRLKSTVLWGNAAVAGLTGFTLVYGGLLSTDWSGSLWPALFAFLINLPREIIKDMADAPGDAQNGVTTLPIRYGSFAAAVLASFFLCILAGVTILPYLAGHYSRVYLVSAAAGVDLPALAVIPLLFKARENPKALNRLALLLKVMMILGILAVLLGKWGSLCGFAFSG